MIIGIAGKKRAGKGTVADFLCRRFCFWELSWAFYLKEIIGRKVFGLSDEQLGEEKETIIPEWEISTRELLQKVGTDLFRDQFDQDIWVKLGVKKADSMLKNQQNRIVFSDCRFPNELNALKWLAEKNNIPFASVLVVREGYKAEDGHASENSLEDYQFDYVFKAGSGDFEALYKQVEELIYAIQRN